MGPAPITFQDIAAWSSLMGATLAPHEVALIKDLDQAWLEVQSEILKINQRADK